MPYATSPRQPEPLLSQRAVIDPVGFAHDANRMTFRLAIASGLLTVATLAGEFTGKVVSVTDGDTINVSSSSSKTPSRHEASRTRGERGGQGDRSREKLLAK